MYDDGILNNWEFGCWDAFTILDVEVAVAPLITLAYECLVSWGLAPPTNGTAAPGGVVKYCALWCGDCADCNTNLAQFFFKKKCTNSCGLLEIIGIENSTPTHRYINITLVVLF